MIYDIVVGKLIRFACHQVCDDTAKCLSRRNTFANSGEYIADQNFAMEFGTEENRPTYIGMSKTLTGPFFLLAPIIGGSLVQIWGYNSMFLAALILSVLAFVIIKFLVRDPRSSNQFPKS